MPFCLFNAAIAPQRLSDTAASRRPLRQRVLQPWQEEPSGSTALPRRCSQSTTNAPVPDVVRSRANFREKPTPGVAADRLLRFSAVFAQKMERWRCSSLPWAHTCPRIQCGSAVPVGRAPPRPHALPQHPGPTRVSPRRFHPQPLWEALPWAPSRRRCPGPVRLPRGAGGRSSGARPRRLPPRRRRQCPRSHPRSGCGRPGNLPPGNLPQGAPTRPRTPPPPLTFWRVPQEALPDVQVPHLRLPPRPRRSGRHPPGSGPGDSSRALAPSDAGPARSLQAQPAERQRARQLQQHLAGHRVPAAVAAAPGLVLQHQGQRLHRPAGPGAQARPGRRHRSPAAGEACGRRRRLL